MKYIAYLALLVVIGSCLAQGGDSATVKYKITSVTDSDLNEELIKLGGNARLNFNKRVALLTGICNVCTFTFGNGKTQTGCSTSKFCSDKQMLKDLEEFIVNVIRQPDNLREMLETPKNIFMVKKGLYWVELTPISA